jgi:murein DD-endopeptidase MepM/ murein hydrolase activator NlpD
MHNGVDLAAPTGTKIYATDGGTVTYSGYKGSFGYMIIINHGGNYESYYAHCSKLLVRKGETVSCGQTIALVGETGSATGPHLNFTLSKDSVRLDPAFYVDPS